MMPSSLLMSWELFWLRRSGVEKRGSSARPFSPVLWQSPLRVWGGGTAALLYLNLAMIEAEFAKHLRRLGSPKAQAADEATAFTDKFVPVFAEVIERRLN